MQFKDAHIDETLARLEAELRRTLGHVEEARRVAQQAAEQPVKGHASTVRLLARQIDRLMEQATLPIADNGAGNLISFLIRQTREHAKHAVNVAEDYERKLQRERGEESQRRARAQEFARQEAIDARERELLREGYKPDEARQKAREEHGVKTAVSLSSGSTCVVWR